MGYWGRERTVLLMWEYFCEHSPLWSRGDDIDVGPIDARDLGLPEDLRDDLADWNLRCAEAGDPSDARDAPTTPREWRPLQTEAFGLAARVQRGLGDDWTVWCLSGGGSGGMHDAGAFAHAIRTSGVPILLRTGGPVEWAPAGVAPAIDRFEPALRREIRAWIGSIDRLPPAEHRAQGLELAGRLHAALPAGAVLWCGGGPVPLR